MTRIVQYARRVFSCLSLLVLIFIVTRTGNATESGARTVKYGKEDIVAVHAKLSFSTLIVLPEDEEILDFTTGAREFWIINGPPDLYYVQSADTAIRRSLKIITTRVRYC